MRLLNYVTERGYTVSVLVSPDHPDAADPTARVQATHGPHCFRWRTLNAHAIKASRFPLPRVREAWE